jgi:hypothetical protein
MYCLYVCICVYCLYVCICVYCFYVYVCIACMRLHRAVQSYTQTIRGLCGHVCPCGACRATVRSCVSLWNMPHSEISVMCATVRSCVSLLNMPHSETSVMCATLRSCVSLLDMPHSETSLMCVTVAHDRTAAHRSYVGHMCHYADTCAVSDLICRLRVSE